MSCARFENIGGIMVEVSEEYGFGMDSLLLAQFASPCSTEYVCDLGTGCGIIPLWWCQKILPSPTINAIEIQSQAAAMAQRSVTHSGLSDKITIHHADLRNWKSILYPNSQNVVTMNPPYFAAGTGSVSTCESLRIARHEGAGCTLIDAAKAAFGMLKHGGRFCICHKPERLCYVLDVLREEHLMPKCIQFVHTDAKSIPWLFLCEARKGSSSGLKVLPPFICKNNEGSPTADYNKLYGL